MVFQGPVRPGTDVKKFRETGKSAPAPFSGPTRPGTDVKKFRSTGRSSGGSSSSSRRRSREREEAARKETAKIEAEKQRKEAEIKETNRKIKEALDRLAQKRTEVKRIKLAEIERKRILQLKEKILRQGGRTSTHQTTDSKTGDTLAITTTKVNRMVDGKIIAGRVFEIKNLTTGNTSFKTFERQKGRSGLIQSGGLIMGGTSLKDIETIKNELAAGETLIYNKITNKIAGIKSKIFNMTFAFTERGLALYNKKVEELKSKSVEEGIKLPGKMDKALDKTFAAIDKVLSTRIKKGGKEFEIKQERYGTIQDFGLPTEKAFLQVTGTGTTSDLRIANILKPLTGTLSLVKGGTDFIFDTSKRGWDDLLFGKRGLKLQRTPKLELIPGVIAGAGRVATYMIPVVGTGIFIADIGGAGNNVLFPQSEVLSLTDKFYGEYQRDTKLKENQRYLTKDEFNQLNKKAIVNAVRKAALFEVATAAAFMIGGRLAIAGLKGVGKYSLKQTKALHKFLKTKPRYAKGVTKIGKIQKKYFSYRAFNNKIIATLPKAKRIKVRHKIKIKKLRKVLEKKVGVKVGKKEFKSYQSATKELKKIKNLSKHVQKIKSEGGFGAKLTEKIKRREISLNELRQIRELKLISKNKLAKIKEIEISTISQKYSVKVPVLRRIKLRKGAFYRIEFMDKKFFQNTISYTFYGKGIKPFTLTFNTLANKQIGNFRTITNALKYGRNPSLILSKTKGDFILSEEYFKKGKKIFTEKFISKFKLRKLKQLKKINIETRKIGKATKIRQTGVGQGKLISAKKIFKRSIPISKSKIISKKTTMSFKDKVKNKNTIALSHKKSIELLVIKTKIRKVIIDTTRAQRIISRMNEVKKITRSQIRKKHLSKLIRDLKKTVDTKKFKVDGGTKFKKGTHVIELGSKKVIQIQKVIKQGENLKKALIASTLPPRFVTRTITKGITKFKLKTNLKKEMVLSRLALLRKQKTNLKHLVITNQINKLDVAFLSEFLNDQTQKLEQILKVPSRTKTKIGISPIVPVIPKPVIPRNPTKPTTPPTTKILIPFPRKRKLSQFIKLSKPVPTFEVVAKKLGKRVVLKRRLRLQDAKNFMAKELDTTLLRTAKLVRKGKSKLVIRLSGRYSGAFSNIRHKLRTFQIKKGKKKKLIKSYIEKRKYALDTRKEKIQLYLARKKKLKLSKLKKLVKKKRIKKLKKNKNIKLKKGGKSKLQTKKKKLKKRVNKKKK